MMDLAQGKKYAKGIIAAIRPYCERVEIAGSILRERPNVNDIDLVVIPKDHAALVQRCKQRCRVRANGDQNLLLEMNNGVHVDIFIAQPKSRDLFIEQPSNWGSILLCRTGSREHNIYMVERAKSLGLKWNPYVGVYDKDLNIIASETEEDIFKALQLDFIPPQDRERR